MYNFLDLVNHINQRLNEAPLTESTFVSAGGFYSTAKNAVNNTIRDINLKEFQWPFNHRTEKIYLETDGRIRYPMEADSKVVDFDTFRLNKSFGDFDPEDFDPEDFVTEDLESSQTTPLYPITYDKFIRYYSHYEYNLSQRQTPRFVFQTQDREIGIIPCADQEYTVTYEYWVFPPSLENYDDAPTIPEMFRYVIEEGAMYYAYMFRERTQDAALSEQRFNKGVEDMREVYINNYSQVTAKRRMP